MAEFPIVGIGSSAGGLEALQTLFRAMPADSGLAFIIAAHLDPTQKSHLTELLGRCTKMPVVQIEKLDRGRARPCLRDRAGPGADDPARASCGRTSRPRRVVTGTRSIPSSARSPRIRASGRSRSSSPAPAPTARSACASSRPKAASCSRRNRRSAGFQGMPRSAIGTGIVDLVLPPDKMPEALLNLARHSYVRQPTSTCRGGRARRAAEGAADARARTRPGETSTATRRRTLLRRIHRRMGLHRIDSLRDYAERLRNDPDEIRALAADLTINVTGFFRDPEAWQVLADKVIAPLVRERPRRIRRSGSGYPAARPARRPTRSRCWSPSRQKQSERGST